MKLYLKDSQTRHKTVDVVFHLRFQVLVEIADMLPYPKTFIYLYLHSTKNKCQLQPMQQIQSLVESCETQEFSFRVLKPEASDARTKASRTLYTTMLYRLHSSFSQIYIHNDK